MKRLMLMLMLIPIIFLISCTNQDSSGPNESLKTQPEFQLLCMEILS